MQETTKLDSFQTRGKVVRIDNPEEAGEVIMDHWKEFWSRYNFNEVPEMPKAYYFNYESNQTGPYFFAVGLPPEIVKDTEGQETLTIPEQQYVIIEKTGEMPGVVFEAWQEVWNGDIDRAYTYDIEEYPDPKTVKLYIAVKN